jgi:hypothetical protein
MSISASLMKSGTNGDLDDQSQIVQVLRVIDGFAV